MLYDKSRPDFREMSNVFRRGQGGRKMEVYSIFKDLAIIIVFAKFFGMLARKCKAPQVVGEILAGL